jgi:carbamoylphosphate synthase small subunit
MVMFLEQQLILPVKLVRRYSLISSFFTYNYFCLVFQTGMVGYTESLTDPSYCGEILVLTFPLIGNYGLFFIYAFEFWIYIQNSSGVPDEKAVDQFGLPLWVESNKIYASALIVSAYTEQYSHWNAVESLSSWLKKHNVPGLYGESFYLLFSIIWW